MADVFRPLQGLVVVDLSWYLPGPFLTRILAALGADVIKVEPPGGDRLRYLPPLVDGTGAVFRALNAGKRSVVLDLKQPAGTAALRLLVDRADVLVEAFRPGVMDRLGVGIAALQLTNPRLVACSLSGFGREGAAADAPGHDLGYVARAGILGAVPSVPSVPIADLAGGALPGAVAILAALLERARTGRGRHLDIALARGARALGILEIAAIQAGDHPSTLLTGDAPAYRIYRTSDDRFVALAALEPEFFTAFCRAAGCEELIGRGLATGDDARAVIARLEALVRSRTREEWVAVTAGAGTCLEAVLTPEEVASHADALALELGARTVPLGPAPALGEHTEAVLGARAGN